MKKSISDIVLTIIKIIIAIAVTLYLGYCIVLMATANDGDGWNALGFVVLLALGIYVNGGAAIISLILLISSCLFKRSFERNEERVEGYDELLKVKKRNVLHYGLLIAYAVISELLILLVGSIIF